MNEQGTALAERRLDREARSYLSSSSGWDFSQTVPRNASLVRCKPRQKLTRTLLLRRSRLQGRSCFSSKGLGKVVLFKSDVQGSA